VKIYVASRRCSGKGKDRMKLSLPPKLRKRERQDETQFTTKIEEKGKTG
jgi:hypothetical protein